MIDAGRTVVAIAVGLPILLLAWYAFAVVRRQARLRAAATDLGGFHQHTGWTQPGAIAGPGFTIRIDTRRRRFRTTVVVPAQAPGNYVLDAGFFATPLDWSQAKVSNEAREALVEWLERGALTHHIHEDRLAAAGVNRIFVTHETISTTVDGSVTDTARLRRIIDVLSRLAGPR